jgi:hypothetical protein
MLLCSFEGELEMAWTLSGFLEAIRDLVWLTVAVRFTQIMAET